MSHTKFELESRSTLKLLESVRDRLQLENDKVRLKTIHRRKKIYGVLAALSLGATLIQVYCLIYNLLA